MKCHLLSTAFALGAAALLGLAAGQARADAPTAPLPRGPAGAGAPVVTAAPPAAGAAAHGAPVVVAPPPAVGYVPVPAACCAPACCAPVIKKVCVGEKATREKTTRVYGEACEDFCVPKCSLFGGFSFGGHKHADCACANGACGGCNAQGCTSCEHHVRTRKYLVVRLKKEEECYNKCHVECQLEEPTCKEPLFHHTTTCADGGCCLPPAGVIAPPAAPPMPPIEKIQPPKNK